MRKFAINPYNLDNLTVQKDHYFRGQFILSELKGFELDWPEIQLGKYRLYTHPQVHCTVQTRGSIRLVLIGDIFDWKKPEASNEQLLLELIETGSFQGVLSLQNDLCGHYVILYQDVDGLKLISDAGAQAEVYYDDAFEVFASQISLMRELKNIEHSSDPVIQQFYQSPIFKKQKLYVGSSTPFAGIHHLQPNHLLDISSKKKTRFYPSDKLTWQKSSEVAVRAALMIQGFVKAMLQRSPSVIGVTAGYDSRILFLSSLEEKCDYYVSRHSSMKDDHYDLEIPTKLCKHYHKKLEIINDRILEEEHSCEYLKSIDFPRKSTGRPGKKLERVFINGNISEVARNYFGHFNRPKATDLSYLNHYGTNQLAIREYTKWLFEFESKLQDKGIHALDLFYWEERIGNWGAKGKTEWAAVGDSLLSPFNSRNLLNLLLSTNRKDRDMHQNNLYDSIILQLSEDGLHFPINPGKKEKAIRTLKRIGLFNHYRSIGLKLRLLRV